MQTVMQIACTKGKSLRDAIANDDKLKYKFKILTEKKQGRKPGWTSIRSIDSNLRGTIKIQWSASTHFLTCRVVNKGAGRPNQIIGAFIEYILGKHKKRIKLITIWTE